MQRLLLLVTVISGISSDIVFACGVTFLTYGELTERSDVVCIVRFKTARETEEQPTDPDFAREKPKDYIVVASTFTVESTLKGKLDSTTVVLIHYRSAPTAHLGMNGPYFIDFSEPPFLEARLIDRKRKTQLQHKQKPEEVVDLLFLQRRPDGLYIPTGGQSDLDLSVRQIKRAAIAYYKLTS